MVMKRNAMRKNLRQSIFRSFGRYIAIVAIIALGAALFVGLMMSKADMVATGQAYTDAQNMFDLRLISNYGWTQEYVDQFARMEGVENAEGLIYLDLIARMGDTADDSVYRFYSIPETVNKVALRGGRMPEAEDECLADGFRGGDSSLGQTVVISDSNDDDSLNAMRYKTFTIVGYVASPLYMDMNRGTTSVGSGSLANYIYIPAQAFDVDYYTEIDITIPGDYAIYTEEYNDALEAAADAMEPEAQRLAQERFEKVKQEAEEEYRDGYQEYLDGVKEFEDGKAKAEQELLDALKELTDGEKELRDNEQRLKDGQQQIADAKVTLQQSRKTLSQSRQTLSNAKADAYSQLSDANATLFENYQTVSENMQLVDNGLLELSAGMIELETGIMQLEAGVSQLDSGIEQMQMLIDIMDVSIQAAQTALEFAQEAEFPDEETIAKLYEKLDELIAKRNDYEEQLEQLQAQRAEYGAQLDELYATRAELEAQQAELEANKQQLENALDSIEQGYMELTSKQAQMEQQFAAAQAQIEAGEAQIDAYEVELALREQEIADGFVALEEGKEELEEAWQKFQDAEEEVEAELDEAEEKLEDARRELADARESIDAMEKADLYILDRTSNVGYYNLDGNSDIVAGVSRVFPVFFLLVASLVCITTMTRMIDEERTQIGTLKALGYSNAAIIGKYMIYSGSGAILGCGLGIWAGCVIFPQIIWNAYCIMLYIQPNIALTVDWILCIAVVLVYTSVLLFVTWYCCRKALQEEPAELIRPKAPEAGKKVLMEYLPFWQKISFLNKVTIRNIFRYRQRLVMMLVGIGGCMALLLTGFGLRDSIVNVADYQFEDVMLYDMEVYFRDGVTEGEKQKFLQQVENAAEDTLFYHQSTVELDYNNRVKEIYMISAGEKLRDFLDLHSGSEAIAMPGVNEVVLSVGVAEALKINEGDTVVLRNGDLQQLELTVSGIYDNYVYNYSIVAPETVEAQWGQMPEQQMAFVKVKDGQDVHVLGAGISNLNNVMNVSISADLAEIVRNMMEALDLVVIVVVFCAGLLAIIVLYNLTNININERIREIATIKVLGFNAAETAAYVFKENLSLTVVGSLLGLVLGKLLLIFVMSQVKIDMVWFKAMAEPVSYVWSIVLTLLSAVVVDFIFFFKLEKINMAEALKSVE